MDTSNLKDRLMQDYYKELESLIPHEYQKHVSEVVLKKLDQVVTIVIAERDFTLIANSIDIQQGWLKTTNDLFDVVCNLLVMPRIDDVVDNAIAADDEEFTRIFSNLTSVSNKQTHLRQIMRDLKEKKERLVTSLYWDLFREEDHHRPDVQGALLQQLDGRMATVPGTKAYVLISKHCQLCELFPELEDAELNMELGAYRFDFFLEKNPSQMDDFRSKIIQVVQTALNDESVEELRQSTQKRIQEMLAEAMKESFLA